MKKKAIALILCGIMSATMCQAAFALDINMDNIYSIAKERNSSISANNKIIKEYKDYKSPDGDFSNSAATIYYTVAALKNANEQIAYGMVSALSAYYKLEASLEDMSGNIKNLDRQVKAGELMYKIGLMSQFELNTLKLTQKQTQLAYNQMKDGKANILANLAVNLDLPNTDLNILDFKVYTQDDITDMRDNIKEYSYETAKKNSLDLGTQRAAVDANIGSIKYAAEKTKLSELERTHKVGFETIVTDTQNAINAAELAILTLEQAQRDYDLAVLKNKIGMLSQNEMANAEVAFKASQNKYLNSCLDLHGAYLKLNAMDKGVWLKSQEQKGE